MSAWTQIRDYFLCKWFGVNCPPPPPPPEPVPDWVVERGKSKKFTLKVPCSVSFDMQGLVPTNDQIEAHLIWGVMSGKDWQRGNTTPPKTTYCFAVRDYKLKCDGWDEKAYYGPAANWDPKKRYRLLLTVIDTMTEITISDGTTPLASASVEAPAPAEIDVWIGWPEGRNGAEGMKIFNLKTTEA